MADYAKSVVDPAKVVIGVQFYGYDWPAGGGEARAYTWDDFRDIIATYGPEVNLVESDSSGRPVQENKISYTTRAGRRIAYFATSRSLEVEVEFKGTLVVNFGLLFALERAQVGSLVAQGLSFLDRCSAHQQLAVVGCVELELARQCVL